MARADQRIDATISISRQSEKFPAYSEFGKALFPIDTFDHDAGALTSSWRIPRLRRQLADRLRLDRTQVFIELMPHVWSPLITPVVKQAGVRYATVVHDADPHPGDPTALVNSWLFKTVASADLVFTLSQAVAAGLADRKLVPAERLSTLFHPDFGYGRRVVVDPPRRGSAVRLLFLGRIMPYKGLPLFLDAVDLLRGDGIPVHVGVFGEGDLGRDAERLASGNAEVVNRWLSEDEIATALANYHAVVVSYTEASQSGVVAAAFGAGRPVIATPVGGLVEQIEHRSTGLIAAAVNAAAIADEVRSLISDEVLYGRLCQGITARRASRSMQRFVDECVSRTLKS